MPAKKHATSKKEPRATRPNMPGYGISTTKKGMLPWKWAEERLRKSRQYWMVTVRPDGRPHVMPVWGLWREGAFYFSTGASSRKGRNLAANPNCIVCNENSGEGVIVEGSAGIWKDAGRFEEIAREYQKKYKMDIRGMNEPFYCVTPRVVFGLYEKKFPTTATRWLFDMGRKEKSI
jgi:general stress protein 26